MMNYHYNDEKKTIYYLDGLGLKGLEPEELDGIGV